jgi:excisionase family DNA binding protein
MKSKGVAKTSHYTGPAKVMTVRDVSDYLRVHPSTIYKLLKRNQIPAFHMGSDWRFNIEAVDRWRLELDAERANEAAGNEAVGGLNGKPRSSRSS